MEEDFVARLLATAGITALVGTRIQWLQRPQASGLPAITLQSIGKAPANDQCGADALKETLVQIDCWGSTFSSALAVSRAVEAAISGQSFTQSGTEFKSIFITGGDDTAEPGPTTGSIIYRARIDAQIWHREEN